MVRILGYLRTSQNFAVQLNTKLDISLAKTDDLQQQSSTLGNGLTSLEDAFSAFTVDVNRGISGLISRFDAVQANCLGRSEAAHEKILLRSVLSHVKRLCSDTHQLLIMLHRLIW